MAFQLRKPFSFKIPNPAFSSYYNNETWNLTFSTWASASIPRHLSFPSNWKFCSQHALYFVWPYQLYHINNLNACLDNIVNYSGNGLLESAYQMSSLLIPRFYPLCGTEFQREAVWQSSLLALVPCKALSNLFWDTKNEVLYRCVSLRYSCFGECSQGTPWRLFNQLPVVSALPGQTLCLSWTKPMLWLELSERLVLGS